jgi:AcrR family transcriptional regulator
MSRRRFENLDPERQQRLLESAAEEFDEKGYDGASLNRIIERSGMSKSSLYYYFDDKADLFTTLLERSMTFVLTEVGGFDAGELTAETYWSELEDLCSRAILVIAGNAWLLRLGRVFYRVRGGPKPGVSPGRVFEAARLWIGGLLSRGQALGVVRTDLPDSLMIDCATALLEAVDRWGVAHWEETESGRRPDLGLVPIALLRRLLSPV